jgi:glucose-6-phosphate 1-epimerase
MLTIEEEVDRVYLNASNTVKLYDNMNSILLEQKGSNSLVVWNPWIEKAKSMVDMPDEGYKSMLCLETGNIGEDSKYIEPNKLFILEMIISN